ncbi:MAG: thioredoxin domain-containing protein [Alphaproteobacteria bacterium]|nr:thioredoxin domain-containing protein [Alphaproteobacteria bacterium]
MKSGLIQATAMLAAGLGVVLLAGFATPAGAQAAPRPAPVLKDVTMGMADAPVKIVEYASVTCAACETFHTTILPRLKARYILTGEANFVLRDHPTPPAPVSFAGFQLARCAGADGYYPVIDDLFKRQTELLDAARNGSAQRIVMEIGAAHGLSSRDVEACIKDENVRGYVQKELDQSPDMTSMPVVFVNGRKLDTFTYETVAAAVDQAAREGAAAAEPPAPTAGREEPPLDVTTPLPPLEPPTDAPAPGHGAP